MRSELRHVGGYFISTALGSAANFLSVPLLYRLLGGPEFGRWALLEPTFLILAQCSLLGTNLGIVKQVNQDGIQPSRALSHHLVSAQPPMLLLSALAALGGMLIGTPALTCLALAAATYSEATLVLTLSAYRAANATAAYAFATIARSVLVLGTLASAHAGFFEVPGAQFALGLRALANIGALIPGALVAYHLAKSHRFYQGHTPPPNRRSLYFDAVAYGFPILLASLLTMIIEYADRFILKHYFAYDALAQYVMFVKIASILNLAILTPFSLWWPTERFRRLNDPDGGARFFRNFSFYFLALLLIAAGSLWFASPWILSLFAPDVRIKPTAILLLLFAGVATGMSYPLNVGLLTKGMTSWNILGVSTGAIAHLLFCFVLIPRFGAAGAAWATLISYATYTATLNALSQRFHFVPFAYARMCGLLSIAGGLLYLVNAIVSGQGLLACTFKVVVYIFFTSVVAFLMADRLQKFRPRTQCMSACTD